MAEGRKFVFVNDYYYHIFNRGYDKREVFTDQREFRRALDTLNFYRYKKPSLRYSRVMALPSQQKQEFLNSLAKDHDQIVEIICYCFMPNHFHLLLRQLRKDGIRFFLSKFTNSYTRFFNTRHNRMSNLFQGIFKAVPVENDEQLLHLSRYIHLNPAVSSLVSKPEDYLWSSYADFLRMDPPSLINPNIVLDQFKTRAGYKKFVDDQIDYAKDLAEIKHLSLE